MRTFAIPLQNLLNLYEYVSVSSKNGIEEEAQDVANIFFRKRLGIDQLLEQQSLSK